MPEVRSAAELLDGYGDVVDGCRGLAQIGDQYWNSIYMPLISSVADNFQPLTDQSGEHKLFVIALESAHKSLELCVATDIKLRSKLTMFDALALLCAKGIDGFLGEICNGAFPLNSASDSKGSAKPSV